MGFMVAKRSTLPFIIFFLVSLLSASSLAGGQRKFIDKEYVLLVGSTSKESSKEIMHDEEVITVSHPRMLKVTTNDYGSYDPPPTLAKPPFKLINN